MKSDRPVAPPRTSVVIAARWIEKMMGEGKTQIFASGRFRTIHAHHVLRHRIYLTVDGGQVELSPSQIVELR